MIYRTYFLFSMLALSLLWLGSEGERATAATGPGEPPTSPGKVLNLRDFGPAGLGRDDSAVFYRALAEASRTGRALRIPVSRLPYRVAPLYLRSNTTLLLDAGVTVQARAGFADGQKLINIDNVSGVQMIGYGATLKMNRGEYKSGEYRHCISLTGASRIALRGLRCESPGGNGLFIAGSDRQPFSEDISLEDLKVENSISAGLLVVSARRLTIRRSEFSGSHGLGPTSPRTGGGEKSPGIELLAGGPEARLQEIQLEDTVTTRNAGDGIRVILSRLTEKSTPVSLTVLRHHDLASGGSSYSGTNDPPVGRAVRGSLTFNDCLSQNAQEYGAVLSFWNSSGARVSFRGLSVIDPDGAGSTLDNAALAVKRGGGGRDRIGNVEFVHTSVRDTRRPPKLDYYFSFVDYSHIGIENVTFANPGELSGARHRQPLGLYQGQGVEQIQRASDPAVAALWQAAEKPNPSTRSQHAR